MEGWADTHGPVRLASRNGANGGRAASATLEDRAGANHRPRLDRTRLGAAGLSPREIEVLELAALGLINNAIGPTLGISPRTVQKHLERVHAKLGVGTRMAAVATAYAISSES